MNSRLLNAALMLIPNKLQHKAVAKALNYLLPQRALGLDGTRGINLVVADLKRHWCLVKDEAGFQPSERKTASADIIVTADLDTLIAAQKQTELKKALQEQQITIEASQSDGEAILKALMNVDQSTLDTLIAHCYAFLRLSPKPRINFKTVTLADIQSPKDVELIRDEAIKLEKSNLNEALRLMEIAQQARPNGPMINTKVQQYRQVLER
ncbi:hypothetical protein [Vibrio agarivorans]|uniref:hypothetical protein n=1 Tax=Vibrio agarivorans TaxID=153622 RepID=UPI00222E36FB|nr:hypothetical protein [Vibrio agarivorans]